MGKLEDRVVLVTGGGRGIGAEIARFCAGEGARIVITDLGVSLDGSGSDGSLAEAVAQEVRDAGGEAVACSEDVSNHQAAKRMIDLAVDTFGRLDVVANVAGILRDRMIFNMSEEEWDAVIAVHLRGAFNTAKHASSYWRSLNDPNGHFRIINFTSGSGLNGAPGQPNYAAAKMGVVGLTWSLANALGKYGVTANAISPSAATRMNDSVPSDRRRAPATEGSEPRLIMPAIAFCASTESDWLTGRVLYVRGNQITLYSNPEPLRTIISAEPWGLDSAFSLIKTSFEGDVGARRPPVTRA